MGEEQTIEKVGFKSTAGVIVTLILQTVLFSYFLGKQVTNLDLLSKSVAEFKTDLKQLPNIFYTKSEADKDLRIRDVIIDDIKSRLITLEGKK